jgi:hypothetical protein
MPAQTGSTRQQPTTNLHNLHFLRDEGNRTNWELITKGVLRMMYKTHCLAHQSASLGVSILPIGPFSIPSSLLPDFLWLGRSLICDSVSSDFVCAAPRTQCNGGELCVCDLTFGICLLYECYKNTSSIASSLLW